MLDFDAGLAPYAARSAQSRGRTHAEPGPGSRSEYQRDRDRIIHSTAFRRLEYKTQVFINHEGDLFRTRLTHSIEVAQIGRTLARSLRLNEDLVEAMALAHDLGHTPFGHVGQDVLNECMQDFGGFEHNLQSLRVVDHLEEHYGAFDGLNLTFETREGILKHCSLNNARQLGDLGQRFIERSQPSLEAQLTNLADEIAYNNHDIDDGLRSGLLTMAQMEEVELFARLHREVEARYPGLPGRRALYETIRLMITAMTADLVDTSARLIAEAAPADHRRRARRAAADPFLGRDARRDRGAQTLLVREPVPPLPGQPHARESQPHRARAVRGVHGRSGAAAARLPGAGRPAQAGAQDRRLHRGHDRPLRDPRAPPHFLARSLLGLRVLAFVYHGARVV